jgi:RNA polymerase sigma-70 factor (ECF subfamily)
VAEREIADVLQSGRRRPFSEVHTVEIDEEVSPGVFESPEAAIAARELVVRVHAKLCEELSPWALHLFELIFVHDCSVKEVCAKTGLRRNAVYAWRSRLPKIVRRCADALSSEASPGGPKVEPNARGHAAGR